MTWLESLATKMALGRLRAKLGETTMGKLGGYAIMVAGAGTVLAGLACMLSHFAAGDLLQHWEACMATMAGGAAAFSPGLGALKTDRP